MKSNTFSQLLLLTFGCWLCLMAVLPAAAPGQEVTRVIMATESWPPFRMDDDTTPSGFRGIDIDLTNALSERIGIPIEIQRHPWGRALEMMRTGNADMVTGAARTPEREVFMHYVPVSYYAVRPVFYTRKGEGNRIQSYDDLLGPSVGYSLRSAYFEPFNSDTAINKIGLPTEVQLLKVLSLGRIDVTIGTDPNISYDVARLGYRDTLEPTVWQPPDKTDLYITLSRRSPVMRLAATFEQALREMMADGTVTRIVSAYR